MTERWTDETLDRFAATVATAIQASDERLTRIEQLVESNNRFLEAFTHRVDHFAQRVDRLTERVDRLTQTTEEVVRQIASTTSTTNQDRMDVTTRLSAINRKVDAIANHLGVI
jgi:ABC-type transporter Mla subunit MlaD